MSAISDGNGIHRPSRVGLVNLAEGDGAEAVQFVLDDLAEAGTFYELHSGVAEPVEFAIVDAAAACDAFVLGFYLGESADMEAVPQSPTRAVQGLSRGAVVYGVCCSSSFVAGSAVQSLAWAEAACEGSGHMWCGGMTVRCAGVLPRLQDKPRMGVARRKVSEATDELLLAIRCGFYAGAIVARPGLLPCLREGLRLG